MKSVAVLFLKILLIFTMFVMVLSYFQHKILLRW